MRHPFSTYAAWFLGLALASGGPPAFGQSGTPAETQADATKSGSVIRGEKMLEPCHLPKFRQEVLCGGHRVFEDRAAGAGREITIRFAVLPAVGEEPQPDPVVVFAGGPGQAAMTLAPFITRAFGDVPESRDIVLIDQRGTGSSNPLECEMPDDEMDLPPAEQRERAAETLRACVEAWDAEPSLYTQELANQDIDEIVQALGYGRINLYGASWGTRSALLYAHRYPDQVRAVVLDGALPLSNQAPLAAGADGERALRGLFEDCAADAACSAAFPQLAADYDRVRARLDDGSSIAAQDPISGEPGKVVLTAELFGGLIRGILYSPELGRVTPWIIHRAAAGDFKPLFGVASYLASASEGAMSSGALLVMLCQEDMTRAASETAESLIGHAMLESVRDACRVFGEMSVPLETPAIYGEEMRSQAPALILSGDRDPITPPRWGEEMARHFPQSLHLVAPATGHNVSPVGCAPDLITRFIESGVLDGELDGSCLEEIERPSFFVDASGPSMAPAAQAAAENGTGGAS